MDGNDSVLVDIRYIKLLLFHCDFYINIFCHQLWFGIVGLNVLNSISKLKYF
jgi:hypothetical protein